MKPTNSTLDTQIEQWRNYLRRRQAIHAVDIDELEDHLREQVAGLIETGLEVEEAFLVAVRRMGNLDALSREFAREHSERLWKQLVLLPTGAAGRAGGPLGEALVAFFLAIAAAVAIKLPVLFNLPMSDENAGFYARNLALFVLPLLAGYFFWKRELEPTALNRLAAGFVLAAVFANAWPHAPGGSTEILVALHLPVALWLLVGMAYAGRRWQDVAGRMDFVRFSGELFIYYVLIALGGGVLTAFTAMIFMAIGIDIEPLFESWLLPCGAMGGVLVAAWLVEAKQSVIENMAPVLTRLFTPLFALMLLSFLAALAWTGQGIDIERDVLIAFDLLLIVVLGLVLYSISARDPQAPPGWFDLAQLVLVLTALAADAVALWAIAARISEFGFSPNRIAALGLNLVLLVNLAGAAWLGLRFLRGQAGFDRLERWQTNYLPVLSCWAAIVVVMFPPLFGFI